MIIFLDELGRHSEREVYAVERLRQGNANVDEVAWQGEFKNRPGARHLCRFCAESFAPMEFRHTFNFPEVKRRERRAPTAERDLQVASACTAVSRWENPEAVGDREMKRRERRAPNAFLDLPWVAWEYRLPCSYFVCLIGIDLTQESFKLWSAQAEVFGSELAAS